MTMDYNVLFQALKLATEFGKHLHAFVCIVTFNNYK